MLYRIQSLNGISSKVECHILLIENKTTLHTGDKAHEITKSIKEQGMS